MAFRYRSVQTERERDTHENKNCERHMSGRDTFLLIGNDQPITCEMFR